MATRVKFSKPWDYVPSKNPSISTHYKAGDSALLNEEAATRALELGVAEAVGGDEAPAPAKSSRKK